jgi:GNAT superfamily N-acetyltransferase
MRLRRVTDFKSPLNEAAMAILHDAISSETQLSESRFSNLLAGGKYQLFAFGPDQDVQGFALLYFSTQFRFAWLDYFAVRADLRGRGLGSELFRETVQLARTRESIPDWLLFEVDDDYEGDTQRQKDCIRRIRFYQRLGARVLENVPYKFPSASAPPVRMRLMAYQLNSAARLVPDDVKDAVREIFINIHGRSTDDQLLRWFEESLPKSIEMK